MSLEIGDRVFVRQATTGALGAEKQSGVLLGEGAGLPAFTNGLRQAPFVRLDNGSVWGLGPNAILEKESIVGEVKSYIPFDRNFVGEVVFIERIKTDKDHSNYNSGEYIIIRQSPNNLYGIKTSDIRDDYFGAWSGNGQQLEMTGDFRFGIVSAKRDDKFVRQQADRLKKLSETPVGLNGKRQYIPEVYAAAGSAAAMMYGAIGQKTVDADPQTTEKALTDALRPKLTWGVNLKSVVLELMESFEIKLKQTPKEAAVQHVKGLLDKFEPVRYENICVNRKHLEELVK